MRTKNKLLRKQLAWIKNEFKSFTQDHDKMKKELEMVCRNTFHDYM